MRSGKEARVNPELELLAGDLRIISSSEAHITIRYFLDKRTVSLSPLFVNKGSKTITSYITIRLIFV